jgi:hypothetical protein
MILNKKKYYHLILDLKLCDLTIHKYLIIENCDNSQYKFYLPYIKLTILTMIIII